MTMTLTDEQVAAVDRLDAALCNFLNAVGDEYDPRKWVPETKRNLMRLGKAYEECHALEVMDLRDVRPSPTQARSE